ncbi:cytochrome P450 [Mycena sp. CBHHK59/15]|nr:cytochrome P450 [Mycena sp. CBHHK59/15]
MSTPTVSAMSAIVPLCLGLVLWIYKRRPSNVYPPGPPGLPVFGNLFDNPSVHKHLTYKAWGDEYGPITYFRLLTEDVFVLNTREVAFKSLEKRSATYADRPRQIMCGELMAWNRGIALCRAGQRHRTYRKLVNGTLSSTASKSLWGVQERAAGDFVLQLLQQCVWQSPASGYKFLDVLRRSVGLNVVGIIFGSEPAAADSNADGMTEEDMEVYIRQADHAHALFAQALTPFSYMVDWLPWLKYIPEFFPFATFKRDARHAREDLEALTMFPYLKTRSRIKSGSVQKSYLDSCFASNQDPTPEEEEAIAWTAMSAYTGGSDTTIAAVTTLFLAAALHPKAQSLAQSEIDAVVGHTRMPNFDDRSSLPYVNAFVQECLRSAPAVPVGVAHRAMESDNIEGFHVPKGTTVIANIWGMLHDSSVYSSPSTFDPSRFLPSTGTPTDHSIIGRAEPDIGSLPFGFGRRICPGMHLADSGIWIYAASILWAFDIKLKTGADDINTEESLAAKWETFGFSDGAILYPLPFEVNIHPRSSQIEDTLKNHSN